MKNWLSTNRKRLGDFKIFSIDSIKRTSPDTGISGEFYLVTPPEWMMVIPVLRNEKDEECFLLVKQYRHGSDSVTLEFPAGMVEPDEEVKTTAVRELAEETGYEAGFVQKIGQINPNPAFMTNSTTTFIAKDLVKTGVQQLDEHEEIETLLMPIIEFDKLVGGPQVNSAITLQAYLFYLRYNKS